MFDLSTVDVILAGALGLTVVGVTELVKRFLKASGAVAYVVSLAVSAAGTAYFLVSNHLFAVDLFVGYTLLVFLSANGIFKAFHTPSR